MALRKCPICQASVKLENLERHVANVHPGMKVSLNLSTEEQRAIETQRRTRRVGFHLKQSTVVVAVVLVLAVAGIAVAWPYLPRLGASGSMHIHPHLQITLDGVDRPVPANIGIDPAMWNDHSLDQYNSQGSPMAPLHTHDAAGTVHVESTVTRDFTLAEFFRVWGQPLNGRQVWDHPAEAGHAIWLVVDGQRVDPSTVVVFQDQMHIQVVCGPL